MWRMNKGIVKDLLPQSPLNIQIGRPLHCGVVCLPRCAGRLRIMPAFLCVP
jgi:hypothetical protein